MRRRLGLRRWSWCAASLLVTACGANRGQTRIVPHVEYWQAKPSGHVVVTKASQPGSGSSADVRSDLGLSEERDWIAGVDLDAGKHRFFVDYARLDFHGSGTAQSTFIFHGSTYNAGDVVSSDVDLPTWHAGYDYEFWRPEGTVDSLRLGVGAYLWNFDARVHDTTTGVNERRSFSHLYPSAQGELDLDLSHHWSLDLGGALAWLASDRKIVDLSAALGYDVEERARFQVGYRRTTLQFHESTNEANLEFSGPFVALSVRF